MRFALFGILFALLSVPAPARADEVRRCIADAETGQLDRRRGALAEAKLRFLACAQESCPRVVRTNCVTWLGEVDKATPSVVFATVDADDRDVPRAEVTVDDEVVTVGRGITLDPGPHRVSVTAPSFDPLEMTFTANEGEKARLLKLRLRPATPPSASDRASHTGDSGKRTPPVDRRSSNVLPIVTATAAVLGFGTFTVFGLIGRSAAADLRSTCAPTCTEAQRDDVRARYIVADVGLVSGIVLGTITAAMLLWGRSSR